MVRAPFLFIFHGIFTIAKQPFSKDFYIKVKINLRSAEIWDYAGLAEWSQLMLSLFLFTY